MTLTLRTGGLLLFGVLAACEGASPEPSIAQAPPAAATLPTEIGRAHV